MNFRTYFKPHSPTSSACPSSPHLVSKIRSYICGPTDFGCGANPHEAVLCWLSQKQPGFQVGVNNDLQSPMENTSQSSFRGLESGFRRKHPLPLPKKGRGEPRVQQHLSPKKSLYQVVFFSFSPHSLLFLRTSKGQEASSQRFLLKTMQNSLCQEKFQSNIFHSGI